MPDSDATFPAWTFSTLKEYVDARLVDLQGQIDRRIETQQRELREGLDNVRALMEEGQSTARCTYEAGQRLCDERSTTVGLRLDEGDRSVREHIAAQYTQLAESIDAVRRESRMSQESAEKAISKAEMATDKRFDSGNAYREQLTEQARAFAQRETVDAQIAELRRQIESLNEKVGKIA